MASCRCLYIWDAQDAPGEVPSLGQDYFDTHPKAHECTALDVQETCFLALSRLFEAKGVTRDELLTSIRRVFRIAALSPRVHAELVAETHDELVEALLRR